MVFMNFHEEDMFALWLQFPVRDTQIHITNPPLGGKYYKARGFHPAPVFSPNRALIGPFISFQIFIQ